MITPTAHGHCTATLLPDGRVLVAGSTTPAWTAPVRVAELASAQLYDPQSGAWSATQDMVAARAGHAAVLLRRWQGARDRRHR